jgi:prepilin-type processing-associated H-X9-DG protein
VTSAGYASNIGQSKADWRRFTTRHNKGGNILFADGHVAHFPWTEVQIQASQMPGGKYNPSSSDANQPSKLIWSILGPVN